MHSKVSRRADTPIAATLTITPVLKAPLPSDIGVVVVAFVICMVTELAVVEEGSEEEGGGDIVGVGEHENVAVNRITIMKHCG